MPSIRRSCISRPWSLTVTRSVTGLPSSMKVPPYFLPLRRSKGVRPVPQPGICSECPRNCGVTDVEFLPYFSSQRDLVCPDHLVNRPHCPLEESVTLTVSDKSGFENCAQIRTESGDFSHQIVQRGLLVTPKHYSSMVAAFADLTSNLLRHPFDPSSFVRDRMGKERPCSSIAAHQHWLAWSATCIPEKTVVRCNLVIDGILVGIPSSVREVGRPRRHAKHTPTAKRNVRPIAVLEFFPSRLCAGSRVRPRSPRARPHARYLGPTMAD